MNTNRILYTIFLLTVTIASALTVYDRFKKKKCKCQQNDKGD